MYLAKVRIGLKAGVTDPEGNNTLKALHLLGFSKIQGVSTQRTILLRIDAADPDSAKADAEKACRRLLTNPIIHDFSIEVEASR